MANIQAQLGPTQPPAAPSRCRELENFYDLFIFLLHGIARSRVRVLYFFPPLFRAAVAPFDLHYCFCLYSKVLFGLLWRVAGISHWDLHPCLCLTYFLSAAFLHNWIKEMKRKRMNREKIVKFQPTVPYFGLVLIAIEKTLRILSYLQHKYW